MTIDWYFAAAVTALMFVCGWVLGRNATTHDVVDAYHRILLSHEAAIRFALDRPDGDEFLSRYLGLAADDLPAFREAYPGWPAFRDAYIDGRSDGDNF